MRFHVLGVSFAPTSKDYSFEGFSQKVRLFCQMMTNRGHIVYHYGVEGSNPICTENINVVSKETYEKVHKSYDFREQGFSYLSDTEAQLEFNRNAIIEIGKRKQPNDFLCCSFGFPQKPIVDAHPDLFDTEIGIGFDGSVVKYRVFESYAWMHTIYGLEHKNHMPSFYDAVIPNFFDLNDFLYSDKKDDYFFFIARMEPLKGLEIALRSAEHVGAKLIAAGTGKPFLNSPNLEFIGPVNIEQRAKYMSKARATFVPTNYCEPFGSTLIESLLCGTPVISTDFGAFTETNIHGVTGYRCRTLEQFFWATENIDNIRPIDCREYAVKNYSLERIVDMYEEFYSNILKINAYSGWYQLNLNRKNLDWLNKYIPQPVKKEVKIDKKILCFYIGYIDDFNNESVKNVYLSEIAVIELAEQFAKEYRVLVFGTSLNNRVKNGVEYVNASYLNDFQKTNKIEIMIIYKYLHYFIEFETNAEKIFLWTQESFLSPYYQGVAFPYEGREFLKNYIHKIDGIVTLSDSYRDFISHYQINSEKVFAIENAIDPLEWYELFKK